VKPLEKDKVRLLRKVRHEIGQGFSLRQHQIDSLVEQWAVYVVPDEKDMSEAFEITLPSGETTGVQAPRWVFHLFGLPHRTAHVGMATSTGFVLLQKRAPTKMDWPDAWDMAVAGHVPAGQSFEEGAKKEISEELGLPMDRMEIVFAEARLVPICSPYFSFDMTEDRNPPFYNAELRQVYAATLTSRALELINPDFEELSGVYICPPEEAWDILARENVASGLRYSLPLYLDWLVKANYTNSP
jgi:isopentenyldiphosphate isomerase